MTAFNKSVLEVEEQLTASNLSKEMVHNKFGVAKEAILMQFISKEDAWVESTERLVVC